MHESRTWSARMRLAALVIGIGALLAACQHTLPAATVSIQVNPDHADLAPSETRSFTAAVTGTDDTAVTWSTTCGDIEGNESTITYIAPTDEGTCELTATDVSAWGWNIWGQLGDGTSGNSNNRSNPVRVCQSGSGAACAHLRIGTTCEISAGTEHSAVVDGSGNVWVWRRNHDGRLGDGTTINRSNTVPVIMP